MPSLPGCSVDLSYLCSFIHAQPAVVVGEVSEYACVRACFLERDRRDQDMCVGNVYGPAKTKTKSH